LRWRRALPGLAEWASARALIGSWYRGGQDQCIPDDPVCSADGSNVGSQGQYVVNGTVDQAAVFAARRY
jgi:cutinase